MTEEIANTSSKIEDSTNIFSWILLGIILLFLIKSGYPFLIAIESAQMYYMFIFVRLDPAPYYLVKFLDSMKYLHFLFFPNLFPELTSYSIPQYETFLTNTSFLYNCPPFIFIISLVTVLFLVFSLLASKKVCSSKRVRSISRSIRKHRLKYMIFHDAFWVTYLYATYFALLQFTQASVGSIWDTINIGLAGIVLVLYLSFTVLMVYLGNKYKNAVNKKRKK